MLRAVIASAVVLLAACGSTTGTSSGSSTTVSGTGGSATTTTAAASPAGTSISETCPPASVVNAALGQDNGDPVSAPDTYGLTCTYSGTEIVPTRIQFQGDTAATFAAAQAAVSDAVTVTGLGDAAFAAGGFVDVLKGSIAVKITSPLSTSAQVETLAHQIVG